MTHLVIGLGEVGSALQRILGCHGYDSRHDNSELPRQSDVIHICFPHSKDFENEVNWYRKSQSATYVVIHSTVPVGTSSRLKAIHSPIRGVHPHLEKSIRTFVKYFGGKNAEKIAKDFEDLGITTECFAQAETTELMKLVDTTSYGVNILIAKEIYRLCEQHGVSYGDVYTKANLTYNAGYLDMDMHQFQKYNIKHMSGPIGGHCIMPNAELLDSWMNDLLKEKNATLS